MAREEIQHEIMSVEDGIHVPHSFEVLNQAALDMLPTNLAPPLVETDVNKLILNKETNKYFKIDSVSPFLYSPLVPVSQGDVTAEDLAMALQGLVTEDALTTALQSMVTTEDLATALESAVTESALTMALEGVLKSSDLASESGISETVPMSQKAVTDAINAVVDAFEAGSGNPEEQVAARNVSFNNALNSIEAITVQGAILEVLERIPTELSAASINETSERQFITADQKAVIQANTSGVDNHSLRLAALEAIDPTEASEGKVKLTEADTAGYLSDKIDPTTLSALGGVIRATGLSGMGTTVEELNFVQGATGNLQAQINALTSIGNFTGTVDTRAEIDTDFPLPAKDDMVIVLEDETKAGQSTVYLYTGTLWEFAGNFTASVRDFAINKLDLESESEGILPKANYEKQDALETPIEDLDNNFTVKNVEGALKELFTSANSFKNAVVASIGSPLTVSDKRADVLTKITDLKGELALAITDKGIPAYPYNTLTELADKITAIANAEVIGDIKTTDEIVTTAYYQTHTIVLNEPVKELQMATTPLVFSDGLFNVAHYETSYPKEDDFKYQDVVGKSMVKGALQVSDTYEYPMAKTDEMFYESDEIDFNEYNDFSGYKADINNLTLNLKALPLSGVSVECAENISLNGIDAISKITSTTTKTGTTDVKYALSFDGGVTWQSFRAGAWVAHSIEDLTIFKSTGMTAAELTAITPVNFKLAMGEAKNFRIAYYLERSLFSETLSQNKMNVLVNTAGTFGLLTTDKYSFTYTPTTKTLVYTFNTAGKYKINYLDGA